MPTTLTDVDICRRALLLIGANPISSLTTEESIEALYCNEFYETTLRELLEGHAWTFATKRRSLSQLGSDAPDPWTYRFQLPSDYLVALEMEDGSDYEIEGTELYANNQSVTLIYLFRPSTGDFPAYFENALEYTLAAKLAAPLTETATKVEQMVELAQAAAEKAHNLDARSRPARSLKGSRELIDIRAF